MLFIRSASRSCSCENNLPNSETAELSFCLTGVVPVRALDAREPVALVLLFRPKGPLSSACRVLRDELLEKSESESPRAPEQHAGSMAE